MIRLFEEEGFVRKECKRCKEAFRTLDPDRETCGDALCEGRYSFIGRKTLGRNMHDAIKARVEFFEKHSHEVIEAYPVVARRREDIEFTIASIAVFQPRVVEGIVPPPGNPLVIPQPSLRFGGEFNDLDNIGKTGRHLTCFVMGGQHSFYGIPKERRKYVEDGYRKDEAIELNYRFLTEVVGIPKESITYKEDRREGGGNAGPSLEAFSGGLELVNAVFMQYKKRGSKLEELPMKVIDTGRGLERIARYTLGSPTIYEASFGPLVERLIRELGVEYDEKLLEEFYSLAGRYDFSEVSYEEALREISRDLGYEVEEIERLISPVQAVYSILDHARTLIFALPDGGIPSNVGGGYNLRLVLRRAISLAERHGFDIDREELFKRLIDRIAISFPRVRLSRPTIVDLFKVERERYKKAIEIGRREVKRILKRKPIGFEELKLLYTSYGIPPEDVKRIASELGYEVSVPSDFYKRISKKEKREISREELSLPKLPATRKLYYEDRRIREFEATVLYSKERLLVLDQTAFYPEGGGQKSDRGYIIYNGEKIGVENVIKSSEVVVHILERPIEIPVGSRIKGFIDRERRLSLTRHHTAAHVLLGALRRLIGSHVRQHGAEKDVDKAHLDVTHYKPLTDEEIEAIERLVNKIIFEDRRVNKSRKLRTEAERLYGVSIYQGGAVPGAILRIVEVEDRDVEACGGTHVDRTGEIGFFKIIRTKRIQDGVLRIEYVAGEAAVRHVQERERIIKEASRILRVEPRDLPKTVKRFFEERKEYKKKYERLLEALAERMLGEEVEADRELGMKIAALANRRGVTSVIRTPRGTIIAGPKAYEKYKELFGREPKKRKNLYVIK